MMLLPFTCSNIVFDLMLKGFLRAENASKKIIAILERQATLIMIVPPKKVIHYRPNLYWIF